MSRIPTPESIDAAPTASRPLLEGVKKQLGVVPNMMRTMAQSPSVLEAYIALATALRHGLLSARLQEHLALVIAEANECDYCLSAHTALGRGVGLSSDEVIASREGPTETILLMQQRWLNQPVYDRLVTNGFSMSGTAVSARRSRGAPSAWPALARPVHFQSRTSGISSPYFAM